MSFAFNITLPELYNTPYQSQTGHYHSHPVDLSHPV